jgi:hypothetical protein
VNGSFSLKRGEINKVAQVAPNRIPKQPLLGLSDDDGIYPADETDEGDEMSLESILSGSVSRREYRFDTHQHIPVVGQTVSRQAPAESMRKNSKRSEKSLPSQINSALSMKHHPLDSLKSQYLEELAEQTYFTFLTDVITSSRARSSTALSVEELAMHRILSERLASFFTQPNQTNLLREQMIQAAIAAAASASSSR